MKIQNTKTISQDKFNILVYGESGVGKTTLASTIGEPTLIISAESGLLSIAGSEIDVIDISTDDDGNVIPKEKRIHRLGQAYNYLLTNECKNKYKWVFIDSLSEISQNLIEKLNSEYPDKSKSLVMYGENSKQLKSIIKMFRDLPYYNVLMTALAVPEKNEDGKRFMEINLVGNFAKQIAAYFDEVFYMCIDKDKKRILITEKTDFSQSKDRSGKLDMVEQPEINKIALKIKGLKNEEI